MPARTHRLATRTLLTSLTVAVTAFAAGCGDDDEAGEAKRETTAAPTTFVVEATAEGRRKLLDFPASVKAGLVAVTLKNSDSRPRSLQILRVEGDHTIDDVLKIVESEEPAKIPSWMQDGGGMGRVAPGETATATQVLAPGTWVLWDDEGAEEGPSNSELGAKGSFAVTGPAVDAELPAQPAAVTASDDGEDEYGFDFKGLKAGTNRVRFENTGEELHHALFFPMRRGATIEDVLEAFQAEGEPEGPPPVDFAKGVGTAVIDGGIAQNISLDLPAGRYAVVCFISDRDGGEPHAAKGMLEELTIG